MDWLDQVKNNFLSSSTSPSTNTTQNAAAGSESTTEKNAIPTPTTTTTTSSAATAIPTTTKPEIVITAVSQADASKNSATPPSSSATTDLADTAMELVGSWKNKWRVFASNTTEKHAGTTANTTTSSGKDAGVESNTVKAEVAMIHGSGSQFPAPDDIPVVRLGKDEILYRISQCCSSLLWQWGIREDPIATMNEDMTELVDMLEILFRSGVKPLLSLRNLMDTTQKQEELGVIDFFEKYTAKANMELLYEKQKTIGSSFNLIRAWIVLGINENSLATYFSIWSSDPKSTTNARYLDSTFMSDAELLDIVHMQLTSMNQLNFSIPLEECLYVPLSDAISTTRDRTKSTSSRMETADKSNSQTATGAQMEAAPPPQRNPNPYNSEEPEIPVGEVVVTKKKKTTKKAVKRSNSGIKQNQQPTAADLPHETDANRNASTNSNTNASANANVNIKNNSGTESNLNRKPPLLQPPQPTASSISSKPSPPPTPTREEPQKATTATADKKVHYEIPSQTPKADLAHSKRSKENDTANYESLQNKNPGEVVTAKKVEKEQGTKNTLPVLNDFDSFPSPIRLDSIHQDNSYHQILEKYTKNVTTSIQNTSKTTSASGPNSETNSLLHFDSEDDDYSQQQGKPMKRSHSANSLNNNKGYPHPISATTLKPLESRKVPPSQIDKPTTNYLQPGESSLATTFPALSLLPSFKEIGASVNTVLSNIGLTLPIDEDAHHIEDDFVITEHMTEKEINFTICHEKGIGSQDYKCFQCSGPVGFGLFGEFRVCDYTGKYYCTECHVNDLSVIPARVVHNWDFKQRRVCRRSKAFLAKIERMPVVDLISINPKLVNHVEELKEVVVSSPISSHFFQKFKMFWKKKFFVCVDLCLHMFFT